MRKTLLLTLLLFSTGMVMAQQYPLVTLQDIQFVADTTTDPPSPLNGDTVQVSGCVLVSPLVDPGTDRRPIIWAGTRWVTYIEDSDGHVYGGLNILQDDTSEVPGQQTYFDLIDTAQIVTFTGVVTEYYTSTELVELVTPTSPIIINGSMPKRPDPIVLQVSDFDNNGVYNFASEKYENMYVEFRNVNTSDRNTSTGTFNFHDAAGNTMHMWDQSGYFTLRSYRLTGLTNYDPPQNGTTLSYIRGVITTRTDGYYIVPMYPGDIGPINQLPPSIMTIRRDAAVIIPDQAVEVSAKIRDLDGTVQESRLYFRVDGGQRLILPMTFDATDTTYRATIPGIISDSSIVDFYIWAKDNDNNVSINPVDTVHNNYFYLVLNRPVGIRDVQYSPFGGGYSGYTNYNVTLTGVVTSDTSDIKGYGSSSFLRSYIQDGTGPWSGIEFSFGGSLGTELFSLKRGDKVSLTGTIQESYGITLINNVTSVVVHGFYYPLPDPQIITTGEIGLLGDGEVAKEQWESVLVEYNNPTITNINADSGIGNYGEILVNDGTGDTRVELEDGNNSYHNGSGEPGSIPLQEGAQFEKLRGIMYYSFSNYKLVPRKDDDFVGYAPAVFLIGVDVSNGWNMVSVPGIHPVGMDVTNWWTDLTGTVYKFVPGSGYSGITTTIPGEGYWMKNVGAETYIYPAIQFVTHDPISAAQGWNMIGGYEDFVNATALTTTPPGQIVYPIYKYIPGLGYQTASTLVPCYGYWVKVSSGCQINIPDLQVNETRKIVDYFKDDLPTGLATTGCPAGLPLSKVNWGKITITDASGSSYTLYAVKGDSPNGGAIVDLNQYELPPVPPAGVFDVRYSRGRVAEDINSSVQSIDLRGVTYPVKVKADGIDIRLQDITGREINTNIKSGEAITISNPKIDKLMVEGKLLPDKYSLEQNFPNPFNPTTTIRFSLPKEVRVNLSLYNILGEKVKELKNEVMKPGNYVVNFNANALASGVYFYRIKAGDFVSTKKMILLR